MSLKHTYIYIFFFSCVTSSTTKQFTLMLDPAGDAQITGKIIGNAFERGITLQCAQELKQQLERLDKTVRVILTRFPGETVQYLQHANFANRLGVDLFIHLAFFQSSIHTLHCFYYCTHPITDYWQKTSYKLTFIPSSQAHCAALKTSVWYSDYISNYIKNTYHTTITVQKSLGIPYKPLHGILAPAIALEMGIQSAQDRALYVQPLAESITNALRYLRKKEI